jgi:hypothetical protein
LHVLSTPPAFVLSQNQTLRKKRISLATESLLGAAIAPKNLTILVCPGAGA